MNKQLNPAKPLQTRDGRPVRHVFRTSAEGRAFILAGYIDNGEGGEDFATWTEEGQFLRDCNYEDATDLMNVPNQ